MTDLILIKHLVGVGLNGWSESDAFKFRRQPPQMKDLYVLGSKSNKLVDFVENPDVQCPAPNLYVKFPFEVTVP